MRQKGFTLLEVLLSVAVLTIIGGVSMPLYAGFTQRNDLALSAETLVQTMRRAELYARSGRANGPWGVRATGSNVVLFQGASYVSRDVAYDETLPIAGSVTISGSTETVYAKLSGNPASAQSYTLTSINNETKQVEINAKGMVEY